MKAERPKTEEWEKADKEMIRALNEYLIDLLGVTKINWFQDLSISQTIEKMEIRCAIFLGFKIAKLTIR